MSKELNCKKEKLFSEFLNQERNIFIWIPEDFKHKKLPVLYLLDGGINEKLIYTTDLVNKLITSNQIEPFIIVGIENINRNFDFTRNTNVTKDKKWVPDFGNANKFEQFLSLELLPFIDANYATNGINAIIGESLGGLLVMDLLKYYPGNFDYYLAIDPSLWWNNHELFDLLLNELDSKTLENKKLWISSSKTISISKFTDQLVEKLEQKSELKSNWNYKKDPTQNHFTIFKSTIESALVWTFKKDLFG